MNSDSVYITVRACNKSSTLLLIILSKEFIMRARVGLIVFMVLAVAGIATAVDQPMINDL